MFLNAYPRKDHSRAGPHPSCLTVRGNKHGSLWTLGGNRAIRSSTAILIRVFISVEHTCNNQCVTPKENHQVFDKMHLSPELFVRFQVSFGKLQLIN